MGVEGESSAASLSDDVSSRTWFHLLFFGAPYSHPSCPVQRIWWGWVFGMVSRRARFNGTGPLDWLQSPWVPVAGMHMPC
jgi:hypothetical protein